jgi:phage-related minor tail protein
MRVAILGFLLITAAGCVTGVGSDRTTSRPWGITDRVEQGVAQLNASIAGLDQRLSARQQVAIGPADDGMADLQALDLSAWELRRQQWVLQRDHLSLAKELLDLTKTRPNEKDRFVQQWGAHAQEYMNQLENLRRQRGSLEQKRLEVEAHVIEKALR